MSANKTLRTTQSLIDADLIDSSRRTEIDAVSKHFATAIPAPMADLIDRDHLENDPIAQQFVPSAAELEVKQDELNDPIGDEVHTSVKGIIHRYPDRCLFKPINVCPVYCRYCFRRETVGPNNEALTPDELETAFTYIENHPEIWEVILSGGEPLIMKPKTLAKIINRLDKIASLGVIRIHTRVPMVAPERIDTEMLTVLKNCQKPVVIVLHANHAKEFTDAACTAITKLAESGFMLLSQSVLLANINDNIEALSQLMRAFVRNRVKPYYLHHADLARGTSHFRVSIKKGQALMRQLRGRFSGICQPTYVLDIPGGFGKVPINYCYLHQDAEEINKYRVKDYQGVEHNV